MNVSIYAIPGINRSDVEILDTVIKKVYGKSLKELQLRTRQSGYVIPRQVAITIMLSQGKSTTEAGKLFNLDHATAVNAKKVIGNILDTKYPKEEYDRIMLAFKLYNSKKSNIIDC